MDSLLQFITEPLAHEFMQRALITAMAIGMVCSIFSCFLILKGWSLMGDALSHAALPGIGIAYVLGLPLIAGAFVAGLACAGLTGFIKNHSRIKEDAVMGIVFSGMFAAGLLLLSSIHSDIHLMHILFGNILGITQVDYILTLAISIPCATIMLIKQKDFMLYCFDPSQARVLGLAVSALHFGLLILLALTIIAALKAAGIILVVAMLIAPGATAFLIAKQFSRMIWIALAVSTSACITGTWLSYHLDAATAPLIVVIQAVIFLMVWALHINTKTGKEIAHV